MIMATIKGNKGNNTLNGTDGNDTMFGYAGNDLFDAKKGNDTLDGGTGNDLMRGDEGRDTYILGYNFGIDTIEDDDDSSGSNPGDKIRFTKDKLSDVISVKIIDQGNDDLQIKTKNGTVTIKDYKTDKDRIELFEFSDTKAVLQGGKLVAQGSSGGGGGSGGGGSAGGTKGTNNNDTLIGTDGNDTMFGYAGNDRLAGKRGNDTLVGGTGNDFLQGERNGDTYILGGNYGIDTIEDDDDSSGSNPGDVVRFTSDNLRDVRSVKVINQGNDDLRITTKNGTVTIKDFKTRKDQIEFF